MAVQYIRQAPSTKQIFLAEAPRIRRLSEKNDWERKKWDRHRNRRCVFPGFRRVAGDFGVCPIFSRAAAVWEEGSLSDRN
jgi:hypothetical protein